MGWLGLGKSKQRGALPARDAPLAWLFDGERLTALKYRDGETHSSFGGWYGLSGTNAESYARAYMTSVWAFRAINVRVQKVAEVLRRGRVIHRVSGRQHDDHPLFEALEQAYRHFGQDVFEDWAFSKSVYGETYLELVRGFTPSGLIPAAVRVLNALAVEPVIEGGRIAAYRYRDGSAIKLFAPEDVAFDRLRNPLDDTRGYSLLAAAMDAVNIDRNVVLLTRAHLQNNARPGLIFTPKAGRLSQADVDLIQTTLAEDARGTRNAGNPLLMPTAFDVTVATPPDLTDIDGLSETQKRRICAAVGVPAALIDYADMPYQLSPEQTRTFYELTLIPEAEKIARVINAQVLPFFDPGREVEFRLPLDEIRTALTDPRARTEIANGQLAAGAITLNEYREMLGWKAIADGDVRYVPDRVTVVEKLTAEKKGKRRKHGEHRGKVRKTQRKGARTRRRQGRNQPHPLAPSP
ncbi:MAG: phage portal protein [Chloroflexi bacterium]|uniref:phage portal protein n=1 Tax=Candidatus Flexifilum breve TaxID=3140694 RepID=UPI00313545DB|nr:phage portal protein [Chloroflexota bacterium]